MNDKEYKPDLTVTTRFDDVYWELSVYEARIKSLERQVRYLQRCNSNMGGVVFTMGCVFILAIILVAAYFIYFY